MAIFHCYVSSPEGILLGLPHQKPHGNMETTLVAHLRTTKLDGGRIEHATQRTCNAWIASREDPPETS